MTAAFLFGASFIGPLQAQSAFGIDNPARNGEARLAYALATGFEGNDSVPIRQYGDQWQGSYRPQDGDNIGVLWARTEAGVQSGQWRIGLLYRAQALAVANRDTNDLAHQYSAGLPYDAGRRYILDYRLDGFEATGANISRAWKLPTMGRFSGSWGLGLSLLRGKSLRMDSATGRVRSQLGSDLEANATYNKLDSKMDTTGAGLFNPPYGEQGGASGSGYALDTGFILARDDGLELEATIADVLGAIRWSHVPAIVSRYDSQTKTFDANGYARYGPASIAQSSYQDVFQTLRPTLFLAAHYPFGNWRAGTRFTRYGSYWMSEVNLAYRISELWRVQVGAEMRFHTLAISMLHDKFSLTVRTNSPDLSRTRALGLTAAFTWPL